MRIKLNFWIHTDRIPYGKVEIDYISNNKAINQFLNNDIQFSKISCLNIIEKANEILSGTSNYYETTGNCCTLIIKSSNVSIINEYTEDVSEEIDLVDFKIILEKLLEFIKTKMPIEYSW